MTIIQRYEIIASGAVGGYLTVDNRLNRPYVYSLMHSARAQAMRDNFLRQKIVSPFWYQPYYPQFELPEQEDVGCYVRFKLPQQIPLDPRRDGLGFIGTIKHNQRWTQINERGELSLYLNRQVTKNDPMLLIENGWGEIYNKPALREFMIEGIWANPEEIPTYNLEKDPYPISEDIWNDLQKLILQKDLIILTKSFVDRVTDGYDNTVQPIKQ